jgi:hypothetical protein
VNNAYGKFQTSSTAPYKFETKEGGWRREFMVKKKGKVTGEHDNKTTSRKKGARRYCTDCGRSMNKEEPVYMKKFWGTTLYFCQPDCIRRYSNKTTVRNILLSVFTAIMLMGAFYLLLPWEDLMPKEEVKIDPRMDYMGERDIVFKNVRPLNDGYQTEMEVEILLTNRGQGPTGNLFIDVFAENASSRIIDDTFNTSKLRYVEDRTTGNNIPSMKSAKVNGDLLLRPGSYLVYIRIYEDGLRGFVEGQRSIQVTKDQVVQQPWQGGGGSRGDGSGAADGSAETAPGFEIAGLLAAVIIVMVVKKRRWTFDGNK